MPVRFGPSHFKAGHPCLVLKVLTVKTAYGSKSADVPPKVKQEDMAHQLLTDLVREEKRRKGSTL